MIGVTKPGEVVARPKAYSVEYLTYIQSPAWRNRRERYKRNKTMCEMCDRPRRAKMHVHHIHYRNLGHERDADLLLVCTGCHDTIHTLAELEGITAAEATARARELPGRGGKTLATSQKKRKTSALRVVGEMDTLAGMRGKSKKGLDKRIRDSGKPTVVCNGCKKRKPMDQFSYHSLLHYRAGVPTSTSSRLCGSCRSKKKNKGKKKRR